MNWLTGTALNMRAIADSGQAFRWQEVGQDYYNVIGDQIIKIRALKPDRPKPDRFQWQTWPQENNYQLIRWHFNLDKNYEEIIKSINRDQYMAAAIKKYWGLRELRQPLFETIISYIISANNSIPLIRRSIELLARTWGKKITADGLDFYTFPGPEEINQIRVADLARVTRVGFRAKYIKETVQQIVSKKFDIDHLRQNAQAGESLQKLAGIGPKVADCVALFALGHDQVIPFDVWMKRVFVQVYGQPQKARYGDLQKYAQARFGQYAGWAHQFLYMYSRQIGLDKLKSILQPEARGLKT